MNPMFSITGQLLKAFPETQVNRDTGEEVQRFRIQLLGNIPLRDGSGNRFDMVTLSVENLQPYKELEGKTICVPFGFFAPGKGNVVTFVPKGAKPQLVAA
jgi:hypothetical protein|tara:strand:- start:1292 stop:1591 length:300 start_codon:yes stop_codon:yes gene_type:complete